MDQLEHFEFSQSSLQDFVDCRRRFQLRYLQHVAWPAIQAEPARENERHMQRGERFHRLAQQYLLGVPEARLTRMAEADADANLLHWWQNFIDCIPSELTSARHVETALEMPLGRFRLVAKYDLVLIRPDGRVLIYDWKTSPRRPSRITLLERLQTRVYPYVLSQAGAVLNQGCAFAPEQVQMTYWFAEPNQPPEILQYSAARCQQDEQYLLSLVEQIRGLGEQEFEMSGSEKACTYCVYRSLCNRGVQAGSLEDGEAEAAMLDSDSGSAGLNFDLEQIGEIGF